MQTVNERLFEDYKQKLTSIYPDAFNPDNNDYRKKVTAIKELEEKMNAPQNSFMIS